MRVRVKQIHLFRAEGAPEECHGTVVSSFAEANHVLWQWSATAPNLGYHKVDFRVTFEDGEVFEGRYDMKPNLEGEGPLEDHIQRFVGFYSGQWRPRWMTAERYAAALAVSGSEFQTQCADFLAKYDLGELAPGLSEVA